MNEVRKTVAASGQEFVDAAGDFIFCSFADRPFRVIIDGQPVTVRVGDKIRPEKRFRSFQLENLDAVNPLAVTLVVGEGDYNSQIIQGEISILPGVRGADGTWRDDTRHTLNVDLEPVRAFSKSFAPGTVVKKSATGLDSTFQGLTTGFTLHLFRLAEIENSENYAITLYSSTEPTGKTGLAFLDPNFNVVSVIYPPTDPEPGGEEGHRKIHYENVAIVGDVAYSPSSNKTDFGGFKRRLLYWNYKTGEYGVLVNFATDHNREVLSLCPYKGQLLVITEEPDTPYGGREGCRWHLVSLDGEIVKEGAIPYELHSDDSVHYFSVKGKAVIREAYSSNQVVEIDPEAGTVDLVNGPGGLLGNSQDGWTPVGSLITRLNTNDFSLEKVVYSTIDNKLDVIVSSGACTQWGNLTRNLGDFPKLITADIQASQDVGAVKVSGEVIRATLEYYFNRPVLDGYMDHVYEFSAGADPYGAQSLRFFGGSRSLAAEGFSDSLTVNLPSTFSITIDNGLPLGNRGEI